MRLTGFDIFMVGSFLILGALNGVLYTGMLRGEAAVDLPELVRQGVPAGSAPGTGGTPTAADRAELDDNPDLPGRFVPNQGRRHVAEDYPLQFRVEFCPEDLIENTCYASNPPTSGLHLAVQRGVRLPSGDRINLPPDPNVYPFEIPRESIPHIQEHAGVFVGYNCDSDACSDAVEHLRTVVLEELALGARVVMAPSSDLPLGTFGLAAWTRIDAFPAGEYSDDRARAFIKAHSCRFDPEGFCTPTNVN
jgi:hypothetical protein